MGKKNRKLKKLKGERFNKQLIGEMFSTLFTIDDSRMVPIMMENPKAPAVTAPGSCSQEESSSMNTRCLTES